MKNLITLETSKTWLTKSESLGKNMQLKILTLVVCAWSICCSAEAVQSTTEEQSSPVPIVEPSRKVNSILLKGTVSDEIYPQLERRVQDLMQAALDRESDSALLGKRSARYNKVWSRVWAGTRDIAELLTEYKGFEQSSEAGDVLLGEKFKLKSKSSADCVQQLKRDHIEKEILTGILQIAQGLGCPEESDRKRGTELGLNQLKKLVGDDEAHKTLETLTNCCATIKVDPSVFDQKPLNVLEIEQQSSNVFEKALASDQVIGEITHIVHKYFNRRRNLARVTAKVMNATLSIAGYSPTMLAPASQLAWTLYIATQGGPEESKLLKEVYLGKRFESRVKTLSACANLAINSHDSAVQTKNVPLLSVSEWMIDRVSDEDQKNQNLSQADAATFSSRPVGLH